MEVHTIIVQSPLRHLMRRFLILLFSGSFLLQLPEACAQVAGPVAPLPDTVVELLRKTPPDRHDSVCRAMGRYYYQFYSERGLDMALENAKSPPVETALAGFFENYAERTESMFLKGLSCLKGAADATVVSVVIARPMTTRLWRFYDRPIEVEIPLCASELALGHSRFEQYHTDGGKH